MNTIWCNLTECLVMCLTAHAVMEVIDKLFL